MMHNLSFQIIATSLIQCFHILEAVSIQSYFPFCLEFRVGRARKKMRILYNGQVINLNLLEDLQCFELFFGFFPFFATFLFSCKLLHIYQYNNTIIT